MLAHGERAVAAHERAVESTAEMIVWADGWRAAVARVSLATAASQQLAKRPQSEDGLSGRSQAPISNA